MLTTEAGPSFAGASASGQRATRRVSGTAPLKRNRVPLKARRPHIHPIRPGSEPLACDHASFSLDVDGADPELTAQSIGDASCAVAACARERAIVVIDEHVGRGVRRPWITQDHHLIVAQARRAMDRPRVFRRRALGRTPQVEHENGVACPVHARNCAAGKRMAGDQVPSLPLEFERPPFQAGEPTGRSPARQAASPRRASRRLRSARQRRAPRLARLRRGVARGGAFP